MTVSSLGNAELLAGDGRTHLDVHLCPDGSEHGGSWRDVLSGWQSRQRGARWPTSCSVVLIRKFNWVAAAPYWHDIYLSIYLCIPVVSLLYMLCLCAAVLHFFIIILCGNFGFVVIFLFRFILCDLQVILCLFLSLLCVLVVLLCHFVDTLCIYAAVLGLIFVMFVYYWLFCIDVCP